MPKAKEEFLDQASAKTLADLLSDPETNETLRIRIINKLLQSVKSENFFQTIYNEKLSYGKCPKCSHENHWIIPEVELNKMGWVSNEQDDRISRFTDKKSCKKWEESCKKKKNFV